MTEDFVVCLVENISSSGVFLLHDHALKEEQKKPAFANQQLIWIQVWTEMKISNKNNF